MIILRVASGQAVSDESFTAASSSDGQFTTMAFSPATGRSAAATATFATGHESMRGSAEAGELKRFVNYPVVTLEGPSGSQEALELQSK